MMTLLLSRMSQSSDCSRKNAVIVRLCESMAGSLGGIGMADLSRGSCLCGAVRFTAKRLLRGVLYCHCLQCRKQSGHFYAAAKAADVDLVIEGGEEITWYAASPEAKRGFCRACGSALFWKHNNLDETSILAGAFDKPTGLSAVGHIFVADKGDYYLIDDGLPQHQRSAPATG